MDNGDQGSEGALWERTDQPMRPGVRNWSAESHYDYGGRSGFWRLLRIFNKYSAKFTLLAVGLAIEKNPSVVQACVRDGHEVAGHGYRWIDASSFTVEQEKESINKTIDAIQATGGGDPRGWFVGRSTPNSIGVLSEVFEERGIKLMYDSDTFADDVPYWIELRTGKQLLMIPYAYDSNDMKFSMTPGFSGCDEWLDYMKRTFDMLYEEGGKMMSLGLHCRVAGRPARATVIDEFLQYITAKTGVWITSRINIAEHYHSSS